MGKEDNYSIWIPNPEFVAHEEDWIRIQAAELSREGIEQMALRASTIRRNVYAPYSHYQVGVTIPNQCATCSPPGTC